VLFRSKKIRHPANNSVKESLDEIKNHFVKQNEHFLMQNERLEEQSEYLRKIESRQKETNLQLEEIDEFLQSNGGKDTLVDAIIALIDIIGDFYYFAAADTGSSLFEQAQMMNNVAINAAETAGLEIIDASNEPFDFRFHSVHSLEQDNNIPNGYIIKTLKYGYIYNEEIIRRAVVVLNKIKETERNEEMKEIEETEEIENIEEIEEEIEEMEGVEETEEIEEIEEIEGIEEEDEENNMCNMNKESNS
jgi:molecular chaperone GrpE (heat shock protein)